MWISMRLFLLGPLCNGTDGPSNKDCKSILYTTYKFDQMPDKLIVIIVLKNRLEIGSDAWRLHVTPVTISCSSHAITMKLTSIKKGTKATKRLMKVVHTSFLKPYTVWEANNNVMCLLKIRVRIIRLSWIFQMIQFTIHSFIKLWINNTKLWFYYIFIVIWCPFSSF